MSDYRITDGLRSLKLSGMIEEYERQQITPANSELGFSRRLQMLICAEADARADRRCKRLLVESGLNPSIVPEAIDYNPARSLDRSLIEELLTCRWIGQGHNITIVGPSGGGKSYLASAIGRGAIRQGLSVRYTRSHILTEDMGLARIDGSLRKLRNQIKKVDLLILDEFGLHELDEQGKEDLLDALEERTGTRSTIVVGQRAIEEWHAFIGTPLLADAILDRMLCRAYNIALQGDSLRCRYPSQGEV